MTAQTQQRMRTSRLLSRTWVQTWPRKETGVLSQCGLLETSLSSSCKWALGFQPDKKPSSEASKKLEFGVGWHDFLDPPFLGHCQLSIWEGLKYGYLPVQLYTLVGVAANNLGKGLADRFLCLRPVWIPFKLSKSIKQPRDFQDEDDFIWLLTNSRHVRHHQPAAPVLLLRRHFRPHHWSAPRNLVNQSHWMVFRIDLNNLV